MSRSTSLDVKPIMEKYKSILPYSSPGCRLIAHGIKNGVKPYIVHAAKAMAPYVNRDSILVPIPSHSGVATTTLMLAHAISNISQSQVMPCIRGRKRMSLYKIKKRGLPIPTTDDFYGYQLTEPVPQDKDIVLIDNVTATRTTAEACLKIIPHARILTFADDKSARKPKKI